jgi:hypothetical protein
LTLSGKTWMKPIRSSPKNLTQIAVIISLSGIVFGGAYFARPSPLVMETRATPSVTPRKQTEAPTKPRKYSDFPHGIKAHSLECSQCHKFPSANWKTVRAEKDAFPDITDYPKHESCVGCHKSQFFKGRPPMICSICHTNPGPRDSTRFPYENPRELFDKSAKARTAPDSDFAIAFPHDKHVEIVSGDGDPSYKPAKGEESCAVCHQTLQPQGNSKDEYLTKPPAGVGDAFWLKRGTFKTAPIGHAVCFTCHSVDSGIQPMPQNCNVCHKLRPQSSPADFDPALAAKMGVTDRVTLTQWRHRESAGTFRHEFDMHAGMECANCHTVATMNTIQSKTKKVPISSCAICHATATLGDGGVLNYEVDKRKTNPAFQCVKCHLVYGRSPIPESHIQALAAAK